MSARRKSCVVYVHLSICTEDSALCRENCRSFTVGYCSEHATDETDYAGVIKEITGVGTNMTPFLESRAEATKRLGSGTKEHNVAQNACDAGRSEPSAGATINSELIASANAKRVWQREKVKPSPVQLEIGDTFPRISFAVNSGTSSPARQIMV